MICICIVKRMGSGVWAQPRFNDQMMSGKGVGAEGEGEGGIG